MFADLFENIRLAYFFLSALLFCAGFYLGPAIVEKDIRWLLAYPNWMRKILERYINLEPHFFTLFFIILVLNNISLFTSFTSGFLIFLPILAAFLTGLHVSVVSYSVAGWQGIWHVLVNPIAWLEFPAAWLSFALGMSLAEKQLELGFSGFAVDAYLTLFPLYWKYTGVLLVVAALLESLMIVLARKLPKDDEEHHQ